MKDINFGGDVEMIELGTKSIHETSIKSVVVDGNPWLYWDYLKTIFHCSGCTMVTLYSGANFTGDARCLKYYKNSTLFDCAPGYYSILAGFMKGLSE